MLVVQARSQAKINHQVLSHPKKRKSFMLETSLLIKIKD